MQDLNEINGWLQHKMNTKVSFDADGFEEVIEKIAYRQHLVEMYIQQRAFTDQQIQREQIMNEVLYKWVYALRGQIQKKLIDIQKSKDANAAYKDIKAKK